jgi:hypothetical protein
MIAIFPPSQLMIGWIGDVCLYATLKGTAVKLREANNRRKVVSSETNNFREQKRKEIRDV